MSLWELLKKLCLLAFLGGVLSFWGGGCIFGEVSGVCFLYILRSNFLSFCKYFFYTKYSLFCLFIGIFYFSCFWFLWFYKKVLVSCLLKVHCLSSLSQRTFRFGRERFFKRVFWFWKKKSKRCLTPRKENGLMSDLFRRLGWAAKRDEFQKFFDNHLICAIDTVSVFNSKPLP